MSSATKGAHKITSWTKLSFAHLSASNDQIFKILVFPPFAYGSIIGSIINFDCYMSKTKFGPGDFCEHSLYPVGIWLLGAQSPPLLATP